MNGAIGTSCIRARDPWKRREVMTLRSGKTGFSIVVCALSLSLSNTETEAQGNGKALTACHAPGIGGGTPCHGEVSRYRTG